ncbi:MAG: steroid delta-isomerase [Halioglobus sp.]|jgi:steroid delta-isomerase
MSALTDEHIAKTMKAYVDKISAGDLDGLVALFAVDAVVEDPIGSGPSIGHAALREFYAMACESVGRMELEGNPRVRGTWGACAMLAYPKGAENALVIETLDVMSFDEAGKITTMKAFWGDSNMREL